MNHEVLCLYMFYNSYNTQVFGVNLLKIDFEYEVVSIQNNEIHYQGFLGFVQINDLRDDIS